MRRSARGPDVGRSIATARAAIDIPGDFREGVRRARDLEKGGRDGDGALPEDTLEKRDRFRGEVEYITAKWGDALVNDPAYNPNLTLTINDFTLALPPRDWPPLK